MASEQVNLILKAEKDAAAIEAEAKSEADKIVSDAQKEAQNDYEKILSDARAEVAQLYDKFRDDDRAVSGSHDNEIKEALDSLRKSSQPYYEQAVNSVVDILLER